MGEYRLRTQPFSGSSRLTIYPSAEPVPGKVTVTVCNMYTRNLETRLRAAQSIGLSTNDCTESLVFTHLGGR
jgi:hypothetical protein